MRVGSIGTNLLMWVFGCGSVVVGWDSMRKTYEDNLCVIFEGVNGNGTVSQVGDGYRVDFKVKDGVGVVMGLTSQQDAENFLRAMIDPKPSIWPVIGLVIAVAVTLTSWFCRR